MKVSIRNLQKKIPVNSKKIKETVLEAFRSEGAKKSGEITVCFVNDRKIRELNLEFFGKNTPTDVIAFDISRSKGCAEMLADIVVSTDTAVSNSRIFNTSARYELYLYVVHGALHLLGYRDKNAKGRKLMQKKSEVILNKIKI